MLEIESDKNVPVDKLRWRLDPAILPVETTEDLKPLREIIGQKRGVEAFRFGMDMDKAGYNVFVTGAVGTGRLSTVRKLLDEISKKKEAVPDDLCYVNNFKDPESPILLRLKAGMGQKFKKDINDYVETLKKQILQLFTGQDYLNRKKEITEEYEKKAKNFYKNLDNKIREQGFALVDIQVGTIQRPEVMPLVDGKLMPVDQIEAMVEKGRFPQEEFAEMKNKQEKLRNELDQIFLALRGLQKEIRENIEKMEHVTFMKTATEAAASLRDKYQSKKIDDYLDAMLEDMAEHLQIFMPGDQKSIPGILLGPSMGDPFQPYQVNLLVDNESQRGAPVIVESFPSYRNLFGSIERVVDRSGIWKTDFSKIKAGSFIKANGGYLVLNLRDAIVEPGVWLALKRSLKSKKMELQTYDPFYLFTTTTIKPEPIEMDIKVIVISDEYLHHLLLSYDPDIKKIFKVRADFDTAMDKNEASIIQFAEFIKMTKDEEELKPFDRSAMAALVEHAVRMTGRQEKIATSFPAITDLIRESDYWAGRENQPVVRETHVDQAIEARVYRSNMIEEHIQEMIDRGTLMIDVAGEVVGQVNGLAVYSVADYLFGKPSRITASTAMGRAGIINIEREAEMSGSTHNKGVLILSGYLREKYARDKPLSMSASIAFEQSYGGVDGDSASSTEIYALLSSLSGVPLRQDIAVTGSVNQKGEIQAIGGVNQKIEGFYDCCRKISLSGRQGVLIPQSNVKDLMLRKDVVEAVKNGKFHIYAVKTIDEGIEILTGKKAGEKQPDGNYLKGAINFLVNEKLKEFAEGLKAFGEKKELLNQERL